MRLLCICPTYGRPTLLANSLALFQQQEYPRDQCKLLILDDAGQYDPQEGTNWSLVSTGTRFASMPTKYQALFALENILDKELCKWDAVVVWDDDEVYLPNHLKLHAEMLNYSGWSHPSRVYCCYDPIKIEQVGGNMWASLAVSTRLLQQIDWTDWFKMREAAFDFKFMEKLGKIEGPARHHELSFMFRWGSTGAPHLQWYIASPDDTETYNKFPKNETRYVSVLEPKLDEESSRLLAKWRKNLLPK